ILTELGDGAKSRQELRRLLLRSSDLRTLFLGSYTLARTYDLEGDSEKAFFYARIAERHAQELGSPEQIASSHNFIGNLLVSRSDFEPALSEFTLALNSLPPGPSLRRAQYLDNIAYCNAMRGKLMVAFRMLFESLRICRRLGLRNQEASSRLTLAYTYLQAERPRRALSHGRRSLAIAEKTGDQSTVKYGLFVLGEAEKSVGNPLAARHHFSRLQEEFYPHMPNVCDLLLLIDVQNLINLKA
ncbi:MAG TPA: tetratricopeptide repeat protein, partial [Thermoanaerobaculia bacterium]|nr:tetratricopeptide repeat protein [Thermoanaerobaculia bacterium]